MDTDLLTSPEAAELSGLSMTQLAWLCRKGKITCLKRGRDWFISRRSLEAHLQAWHPERPLHQGGPDA